MAVLPRQLITIPIGGGLETDLADKLLPIDGRTLTLQNAVFNQHGKTSKRAGTVQLAGAPAATWKLATRRDALINLAPAGPNPIAAYSAGAAGWTTAGTPGVSNTGIRSDLRGPVTTNRMPAFAGTAASVASPDIAYNAGNNMYVVVFDGTVPKTLFLDATTGQRMADPASSGATTPMAQAGCRPRVCAVGTFVVVAYKDSSGLLFLDIYTAANIAAGAGPTTAAVSTVNCHATDPYIDLISLSSTTVDIAYRSNVATTRRLTVNVSTVTVTLDVAVTTHAGAAIDPSFALAWMTDPAGSGRLALITSNPGTGAQVQWDLTGGLPAISYVLPGPPAVTVTNITGHTISANSTGEFNLVSDGFNPDTWFYSRTVAGGITTGAWIFGIGLRSKTFRFNGDDYVIVQYGTSLFLRDSFQQSYFLVRVSPTHLTTPVRATLARIMMWQGTGAVEHSSGLTSVRLTGNAALPTFVAALPKVTNLEGTGTITALNDRGLDIVGLTFNGPMSDAHEATGALMVPGGSLLSFDGAVFIDDGFPLYPEPPTTPGVETPGGLTAGLYSWKVVYRDTDTNGNIIRSRPSGALQRTIAGAAERIDIVIGTLRLGARANTTTLIELYRGVVNDASVYRLVTTLVNNPAVSALTFSDGATDAAIQGGEPLYTTGNVLANDATPGTRAVVAFRDRFWFLSDDDRKEAWYSDVINPGFGLSFSEQRIVRIDDEYGDMTAISAAGTSAVVFKMEAIYAINGDGPNSLGQGGFNDPQRLVEGVGCVDPRALIQSPVGIFFKSRKGIWLLDGAGNPTYVGAPVARYNAFTVVAAILVAKQNQVRFYTSGGTALVYDYVRKQWSTFDLPAPVGDAITWATVPVFAGTGIRAEDTTGDIYDDSGTTYPHAFETPWISIGGLQGVERCYEIQGVGDAVGAHTVSVSIQYDNASGPTSPTYTKVFATGGEWEWRLRPARQLATAMKIRVTDTSATTAGFNAVAIALLLGVEPAHLKRFQVQAKSLL